MNMSDIKNRDGRLSKLVQTFMDNKRTIASYNEEQAKLKEKIDKRMVLNNCKILFYNGEYIQKADKPKVSIDVVKFKSATNNTEFMQCVKVDVAKARKVLASGQISQLLQVKSGDKLICGNIIE
jgi:hypothetical protein